MKANQIEYVDGATYRPKNRHGARITLDRKWSPSMPWCIFVDGTAVAQRGTLDSAKHFLKTQYGIYCDNADAINPGQS